MKLITHKLSRFSAFVLLSVYLSSILTGCFQHYFRTGTIQNPGDDSMLQLMRADKYFILHAGNKTNGLVNIHVNGNIIEGDLVPVPPEHNKHLNPDKDRTNRVKKDDKLFTLAEVHLYTSQLVSETHVSIPVSSVSRVDVYEFDKAATTSNHTLSWIGVGIVGAAATFFIVMLIACNCPQVYYADNGHFEFKSGVYSGAVNSTLERTDFLPLEGIKTTDNSFQFRIKNLPEEEQFINQVQLMSVEHPANVQVMTDRNGKVLSYENPIAPVQAYYNGNTDTRNQLKYRDQDVYSFQSRINENGFSSVNLRFNKPTETQKGKLLIHAGNSRWSGYLNKEFISLFGNSYDKWRKQEEEKNSPNAKQWMVDQGLPLKVWVETANGWEYVDHFALTGNTASRDMIMEIDLSKMKTEQVNIRMECAYQFWDLDYAAMDFSKDPVLNTSIVNASRAITSEAKQVMDKISGQDDQYLNLKGDDYADLEFPADPATNKCYFLISTGYYHIVKTGSGKPDISALSRFREKGYFDLFSRSKYSVLEQELAKAKVKN